MGGGVKGNQIDRKCILEPWLPRNQMYAGLLLKEFPTFSKSQNTTQDFSISSKENRFRVQGIRDIQAAFTTK